MREHVIRNLMTALGGQEAITERLGVSKSTIPNWYIYGIPKARWPDVLEMAQEAGMGRVTVTFLRTLHTTNRRRFLGSRNLTSLTPWDRRIVSALEFGQKPVDLAASLHIAPGELRADIRRLRQAGMIREPADEPPGAMPPNPGNVKAQAAGAL